MISRESKFPEVTEAPLDTRRLIRNRRYCHVLSKHHDIDFDDVSIACAWKAFQHEMAFVPAGSVRLMQDAVIELDRRYIDVGLERLRTERKQLSLLSDV